MAETKFTGAPERAPAPAFGGLTVEQVEAILGQIASTADTLVCVARAAAERAGISKAAYELNAVVLIGERIGVLADMASSSVSVGSPIEWFLGPYFCEKAEVHHG